MDNTIQQAVERAVELMRKNLGERLTVDDIAAEVMYSRFYFTRVFQRATGVSPARFLSALRIEEAKRLLLSTSHTVVDISHYVGYSSPGSFTARFKNSVGMSPAAFRQMRDFALDNPIICNRAIAETGPRRIVLHGSVRVAPDSRHGLTFIGLFRYPILQGKPVECTMLPRPMSFTLRNVPPGTWYLLAQSVAPSVETMKTSSFVPNERPLVACHGPITARLNSPVMTIDINLRPMRSLDPPVLLALLDTCSAALHHNTPSTSPRDDRTHLVRATCSRARSTTRTAQTNPVMQPST